MTDLGAIAGTTSAMTVIPAISGQPVVLPPGIELDDAAFSRVGADLVVRAADGETAVVRGFYLQAERPPLFFEGGEKHISGELAIRLAGPLAPGQIVQVGAANLGDPIGRVENVGGTVTATRSDGSRIQINVGDPVYQGDVLESAATGGVGVALADETTFSMGPDGRMVLDEMIYDPGSQRGSLAMSVLQGVFTFVSGQVAKTNPDAMVLETPVATIGIRGTQLGFRIAGGSMEIVNLPHSDGSLGEITVKNAVGVTTLNSSYQAVQVLGINVLASQPFTLSPGGMVNLLGGSLAFLPPSPGANRFGVAPQGQGAHTAASRSLDSESRPAGELQGTASSGAAPGESGALPPESGAVAPPAAALPLPPAAALPPESAALAPPPGPPEEGLENFLTAAGAGQVLTESAAFAPSPPQVTMPSVREFNIPEIGTSTNQFETAFTQFETAFIQFETALPPLPEQFDAPVEPPPQAGPEDQTSEEDAAQLEVGDPVETSLDILGVIAIARSDFGVAATTDVFDDTLPRVRIVGEINSFNDYDIFSVPLNAGETLYMDIDYAMNVGDSVDTIVNIYTAGGSQISYNDDSSTTNGGTGSIHPYDSFLTYEVPFGASGAFYVVVTSFPNFNPELGNRMGNSAGGYELQLSIAGANDSSGFGAFPQTISDNEQGLTEGFANLSQLSFA